MPYRYHVYPLLVIALLISSAGLGQQRDTLAIHFDFSKARIRQVDAAAIDSAMAAHARGSANALSPIRTILLSGHCDNTGGDPYNDSLSLERAHSTRAFLRSRGVADSLFRELRYYGRHRPLNDNGDPEKRQQNRRVEIVLLMEPATRKIVKAPPTQADTPIRRTGTEAPPRENPFPTLSEVFSDTAALAGRNIVLHNLNFYGNRHVPLPEAQFELEQLLKILKQHPGLRIEIQGYICCYNGVYDGYDEDTRKPDLSLQRAKFVYTWLVDGGIEASRMSYRGFGSSNKLYPQEKDEREKMLNRRVEIRILRPEP